LVNNHIDHIFSIFKLLLFQIQNKCLRLNFRILTKHITAPFIPSIRSNCGKHRQFCQHLNSYDIQHITECNTLLCQVIYCVKWNAVSTLALGVHKFNFPLSTCCRRIILRFDSNISSPRHSFNMHFVSILKFNRRHVLCIWNKNSLKILKMWSMWLFTPYINNIFQRLFNKLSFQSSDHDRIWWRLFKKRVVCTNFDTFIFTTF
jgi:hypothetical protein